MKIKLIDIVSALLVINFVTAQDCLSKVNLKVDDRDASIYINDELIGTGNVEIELSKGEYDLYIREAGLSWDANFIREKIEITECSKNYEFNFSFDELVYFDSSPQDVYVFSNDSLLGNSPMFIPKEITDIRLTKPFYEAKTIQLDYREVENPVKLDFNGVRKNGRFVDTQWFKALIGSAIVLGGIAAYYKIQADQSFDEYKETNQQEFLDKTDNFDLISGVAFGALQVNFAALLYLVLTDK